MKQTVSHEQKVKDDVKKVALDCMKVKVDKQSENDTLSMLQMTHAIETSRLKVKINLERNNIAKSIMLSTNKEHKLDNEAISAIASVLIPRNSELTDMNDQASLYVNAIFASEKVLETVSRTLFFSFRYTVCLYIHFYFTNRVLSLTDDIFWCPASNRKHSLIIWPRKITVRLRKIVNNFSCTLSGLILTWIKFGEFWQNSSK